MNVLSQTQQFAVMILPLMFAITLHEVAHGWVANFCGDPTAKRLGRLSLNPLQHIDPIGSILVPSMVYLSTGMIFGWAKPVPVNWYLLKKPRRDMALVALAGPMANLIMALTWAFIAKFVLMVNGNQAGYLAAFLYFAGISGISVNLFLMILNLIPIPPLDGSKVLTSIASAKVAIFIARYENYGFIILALLLMTGILTSLLMQPYLFMVDHIYNLILR